MTNILAYALMVSVLMLSFTMAENELVLCNCDNVGFWTVDNILECQKVSDFLIAVAYFSIPIELIYFVSCSNFPFKWVLLEFIAFIVLCGMTHFLNGWTYGPHSFRIMLALTVFKVLTAFVSFATAITLISVLPLLLKVKIRELMLRKKTCDLDREVGMIRKQTEAGMHVRMLTREIRKSLDRHTILYTTLVELSKALDLENCAIWMPNEERTVVKLLHELKVRDFADTSDSTVPKSHPDVIEIKGSHRVKLLNPYSPLAIVSSGSNTDPMAMEAGLNELGQVAAIRMPILRVSNFKGGTPEMVPACYAILVLVLPGGLSRRWSNQEVEIVEVVADQVTVALSHAAVLEESQHMREQLEEQNRVLQRAREDALMASRARNAFQMVMRNGLTKPMHSILGLLSLMHEGNLSSDQNMLIKAMLTTSNVLSTLINDTVDTSTMESGKFTLKMKPFRLHSLIKDAICIANCLSVYKGYKLSINVDKLLPDFVMGDEVRVFQVILHMIGSLLDCAQGVGGALVFQVLALKGNQGRNEVCGPWRSSSSSPDGNVYVRFEVGITNKASHLDSHLDPIAHHWQWHSSRAEEGLSFSICRKLVQLMQGDIWVVFDRDRFNQGMTLVLHFPKQPSSLIDMLEPEESSDQSNSSSFLRGLKVLLADSDDVSRAVTRKLLEKSGCIVSTVSSGFDCLSALGQVSSFQMVVLDLHMSELDGYEVAVKIRKSHNRNRPLIVALTACDDPDIWQRCFNAGIQAVINKPIFLQGIKDELRKVLQANCIV